MGATDYPSGRVVLHTGPVSHARALAGLVKYNHTWKGVALTTPVAAGNLPLCNPQERDLKGGSEKMNDDRRFKKRPGRRQAKASAARKGGGGGVISFARKRHAA